MKYIEIKNCKECPYREELTFYTRPTTRFCEKTNKNIDKRVKTFPKFCPLETVKNVSKK